MAADDVITLLSADGEKFDVRREDARRSVTLAGLMEEVEGMDVIPVPTVQGATLARVLEYCTFHADKERQAATGSAAVLGTIAGLRKRFDEELIRGLPQKELFDLTLAANYLDIGGLLDLTCGAIADMIKGKTTEEIRAHFNIQNDLTPHEEEQIRKENAWAFV